MAELRYAVRALFRNPSLAFAAIICLALGIGANTTIFSVVNGVLLKPLAFPEPERGIVVVTYPLALAPEEPPGGKKPKPATAR